MVPNNSLDEVNFIATLLCDVQRNHGVVFNTRALSNTVNKLRARCSYEGLGFLTKALPRLGKAFNKALSCDAPLNCIGLGFKPQTGTVLPIFMGEFFRRVLHSDGTVLQDPCLVSIGVLQQVLFVFYKYELPYTDIQEQKVISKFEQTELDLERSDQNIADYAKQDQSNTTKRWWQADRLDTGRIVRVARNSLSRLFGHFDPRDIRPRHGPGAVATKQQLWAKYQWSNVSDRITEYYPFDEYFCSSMGHVCDTYQRFSTVAGKSLPARVILVPKDSRGPRLISCEPVDNQWIQQGLGGAVVRHVEQHPLTKWNVFYTNQQPNQLGALLGSETGRYATLDLNEASDRISVDLVHLLFPEYLCRYLDCCRSLSTVLPDGREIVLRKFAPMGSALCFPILALTIWALLDAGAPDKYTRECILVYGDDVIVPTAYAADAMNILESFGLKINRDKSCTKGFFRESCGVDAYKGVCVTPIKCRSVWSSVPCPESYSSWVAYANSFYDKKYFLTYDYIVGLLTSSYWPIADDSMLNAPIRLREVPEQHKPVPVRTNSRLQRREYLSLEVKALTVTKEMQGWDMLLRFFAESACSALTVSTTDKLFADYKRPFSVRQYAKRRASILVRRWR